MPKLLTKREMEIFRAAARARLQFLEEYNDGQQQHVESTMLEACQDIAKDLSFTIDEDDIAEMCEEAGGS